MPAEAKTWTFCDQSPTRFVGDLEAAIDFYEQLGFTVAWRYPDPPQRPDHAGICQGDVQFMLVACDNDHHQFRKQTGYVFVKNVTAFHAHCKRVCPDRISELGETDYGMRDFTVHDPWDNRLTFGEAVEDE